MTKADLVESIQTTTGLSKNESSDMFEIVFSILKGTMASGEKIKVAGFGTFEVREKKDRRGRNPKTGVAITIPARRILTFRPSTILRGAINTEF